MKEFQTLISNACLKLFSALLHPLSSVKMWTFMYQLQIFMQNSICKRVWMDTFPFFKKKKAKKKEKKEKKSKSKDKINNSAN